MPVTRSKHAFVSLALAAALVPAVAGAQNQVLDFAPFVGQPDYTPIAQTYGDLPGALDVSNATRMAFGNAALVNCGHVGTPGNSGIELWNDNYSDLVGIGFACTDGRVAELFFQPLGGRTVTLNSFDFGSYFAGAPNFVGPARPFTLNVYDGLWNLLDSQSLVASTRVSVVSGLSSANGLYLQWGTDWDVGIDNIDVTVAQVGVVPEPSTYALLATGLLGIAGAARARRRRD